VCVCVCVCVLAFLRVRSRCLCTCVNEKQKGILAEYHSRCGAASPQASELYSAN